MPILTARPGCRADLAGRVRPGADFSAQGRVWRSRDNVHDGYPNDGYPNDGYPNDGYPNDGYPNDGYPNDGYPNDGYPNDGYPNDGYPNDGYPNDHHARRPKADRGRRFTVAPNGRPGPRIARRRAFARGRRGPRRCRSARYPQSPAQGPEPLAGASVHICSLGRPRPADAVYDGVGYVGTLVAQPWAAMAWAIALGQRVSKSMTLASLGVTATLAQSLTMPPA